MCRCLVARVEYQIISQNNKIILIIKSALKRHDETWLVTKHCRYMKDDKQ